MVLESIKEGLEALARAIENFLVSPIRAFFEALGNFIGTAIETLKNVIGTIISIVLDILRRIYEWVISMIQKIVEFVISTARKVLERLYQYLYAFADNIISSVHRYTLPWLEAGESKFARAAGKSTSAYVFVEMIRNAVKRGKLGWVFLAPIASPLIGQLVQSYFVYLWTLGGKYTEAPPPPLPDIITPPPSPTPAPNVEPGASKAYGTASAHLRSQYTIERKMKETPTATAATKSEYTAIRIIPLSGSINAGATDSVDVDIVEEITQSSTANASITGSLELPAGAG